MANINVDDNLKVKKKNTKSYIMKFVDMLREAISTLQVGLGEEKIPNNE